jgi:D-alanyl-D-alanine carboxypeptidase
MDNTPFDIKIDVSEPEAISRKQMILNTTLLALIVWMIVLIHDNQLVKPPEQKVVSVAKITETHTFDDIALTAKSAYVLDVATNNVIYQKNSNAQMPLASLTKLMMALTASDLLPKDSQIKIRKEFLQEDGDSGLALNESWKLSDLLDFSLVTSSNDGARSIASVVGAFDLKSDDLTLGRKDFITKMNLKAQQMNLKQTYFINESGLDIAGTTTSGGYGSATDVATLLKYILAHKPELLEATKYPASTVSSNSKSHKIKNTNIDVGQIPGLIASKTGYTSLAGGNLAIAFDASMGRPIIVVVLGSTEAGRFADVQALVKASQQYVAY